VSVASETAAARRSKSRQSHRTASGLNHVFIPSLYKSVLLRSRRGDDPCVLRNLLQRLRVVNMFPSRRQAAGINFCCPSASSWEAHCTPSAAQCGASSRLSCNKSTKIDPAGAIKPSRQIYYNPQPYAWLASSIDLSRIDGTHRSMLSASDARLSSR